MLRAYYFELGLTGVWGCLLGLFCCVLMFACLVDLHYGFGLFAWCVVWCLLVVVYLLFVSWFWLLLL